MYVASLLFYPSCIDLRSNTVMEGYYLPAFLFSLSGILAIDGIAAEVMKGLKIKAGAICWIGRHSMQYFVAHWIVLTLCLILFRSLFVVDWRILAWVMGAVCLLVPAKLQLS